MLRVGTLLLCLQGPADSIYPTAPAGFPAPLPVPGASAASEAEMQSYRETIPGSRASFDMLPVRGGTFRMGSPETERGRKQDEGPQREVAVAPFWMGRSEVTWDEYQVFQLKLDLSERASGAAQAEPNDAWADAVSRPTPPYVPMDFGMGIAGYPAVCMTQFAARQYTKWLSYKTGRFYRLPSEAEWEYACRAGTTTAYSFGDDPSACDAYARSFDNAHDKYQRVGQKQPNPWGLFDMHGNVAEWCLDAFDEGAYAASAGKLADPILWPSKEYPRIVRGGSYNDAPKKLRSAARLGSKPSWKVQDPQVPKSIWYFTDAPFVGMRVVRPVEPPRSAEWPRFWDADLKDIAEIEARQRRGGR
jgi:formylglycine-generating enzyme required for sulfatase activity